MLALLQSNEKSENHNKQDVLNGIKIDKINIEKDSFDSNDKLDKDEYLLRSPTIPREIYTVLPKVLREGSDIFSTAREKDIFLTSALTILSGCFPSIYGIYDNKKTYPNLYCFIIAPPASGKGALASAKDLGMAIHNELINNQPELNIIMAEPEPVNHLRYLFLPGNISAAAMITRLHENNGIGIICETEADSLTNSLKQDWGGFSDLLRKAFQHEPFSYARITGNQFIEISRPKLSVALTGTPNQMRPLMKSVYDGLFSRFIFYIFRNIPKWKDPSPKKSFIYDSYMLGLQEYIKSIYDYTQGQEYIFDLLVIQWLKLNKTYEQRLKNSITFVGEDTSATIFRLGLIHFRIAMILSILRYFENKPEGNYITCEEVDYSIAELLTELYLEHGLLVYKILNNQLETGLGTNIERFFKALPLVPFKRKEAVSIGESLGIAERTVSKYLRTLKENNFLKQEVPQGSYQVVSD